MKTTQAGLLAEAAVAARLEADGFELIGRNWKTAVCELDIVAKKDGVVYFTEVKFRNDHHQGSGWDYIGPTKIRKMVFAARIWCQYHGYEGDYRLLGAEVSGQAAEINVVEIDI